MTQYLKESFSVASPSSQKYRDNWERIFRKKRENVCHQCDRQFTEDEWEDRHDLESDPTLSVHADCCEGCKEET